MKKMKNFLDNTQEKLEYKTQTVRKHQIIYTICRRHESHETSLHTYGNSFVTSSLTDLFSVRM